MKKKIILTERQHSLVINKLLQETSDKIDSYEKNSLDEGVMDWIKYGISLLGRYKAGGKIFNKRQIDQESAKKIANILNKWKQKGDETISNLDAEIEKLNSTGYGKFPNNQNPKTFLNIVLEIAAVYDSIVESTKKDPKEPGYMPIDMANDLINDLRAYVNKFLDVDLSAAYSSFNENEDLMNENYSISEDDLCEIDENFGLNEADEANDDDVRSYLDSKRKGGEDFQSTRMDTLKSNKLPLTLAGVGASLGAFSWLVNTQWFKDLFSVVTKTTSIENIQKTIQVKTEILARVSPKDGMTQTINLLNNSNLTAASSPEDFLNQVKILGGGNLQEGIKALTANNGLFPSGNVNEARAALLEIAKNPHGHGDTLGEIFKGNWAGTGKRFGDVFVTQPGGTLKTLIVKTLVISIPKIVTRTAVKTAAAYGAAKGLAGVLGPLGIGLVTAGALVKLMRVKGQKSSRAATLNSLYQSLRDIEGGTGVIDDLEQGDKEQPNKKGGVNDDLYNSLKNLFQFIVNNKNTIGSNLTKESYDVDEGNIGDRRYKGGQMMKGGQRAKQGGETQTAHDRFFGNKPFDAKAFFDKKRAERDEKNKLEESELMFEGKYIKDKRVLQYMSKSLPFDKVNNFENLIGRVEYIRNVLKKMGQTDDKVINNFLSQLNKNPIMTTDFSKIFEVDPNNAQQVNALLGMVKETLIAVYRSDFKFGNNIVDKMSTLGGGNINKVAEEAGYNATQPNKSFTKDAQRTSNFKNNLVNFLKVLMSMFQYLNKLKTQQPKQQKQIKTYNNNTQQPVTEITPMLNEEINKIKRLINY